MVERMGSGVAGVEQVDLGGEPEGVDFDDSEIQGYADDEPIGGRVDRGDRGGSEDNPDGLSQPARELAKSGPQPRTEDGKFDRKTPKADTDRAAELKSPRDDLMDEIERSLKGGGAEAIDKNGAKGKDSNVKTDPKAKQAAGATDKTKPEQTSKEKTTSPSEKDLAKAREVLKLGGWKDEEIAELSPVALAETAKVQSKRNAEKDRELRGKAQGAKGKADDHTDRSGVATEAERKAQADEDAAEAADIAREAGELFKSFADPGDAFKKSISTFGHKLVSRQRESVRKAIESTTASLQEEFGAALKTVRDEAVGEVRLELAIQRLSQTFSELKTSQGRTSFQKEALAMLASGNYEDHNDALDAAAHSLFAKEAVKRDGERQNKIRDAQARGQFIPESRAASRRPLNEMEEISERLKRGPRD